MGFPRVRFNTRWALIGIAALAILGVAVARFVNAGLLFVMCLNQEREEIRRANEARDRAEVTTAPFVIYQQQVAEYHTKRSEYHARRKWLYLRAMVEFWAEMPRTSPSPRGLTYPEVPHVPPPTPLPSGAEPKRKKRTGRGTLVRDAAT